VYVSDLTPNATPVNGWGPYERDRSNGEELAGDGQPLRIGGTTYTKGLGVHAASDLRYTVPAGCSTFEASIGVDDEVANDGSVIFEVWKGTTTRLHQSATLTGAQGATAISVPLAGATTLRLVVSTSTGGNAFDHADWGNARFVCAGGAPSLFGPRATIATGSHAHGAAIADLNGDAKNDLLVTNAGNNTVSVLLGNGTGGFAPAVAYATGAEPKNVALADLNGDAKLDLVTANQGSASITVRLGNGNGTFQARVDHTACVGTHEVALADLNADGRVDAAAACWGGSVLSVLLGNGSGGFAPKVDLPTGAAPHSIVVADFNADGKRDLATANHDSANVSILLGNGNGTFLAATNRAVGSGPHSLRVGDLNGDGRPDLAVANDASNTVSVLLATGTGTLFQAATSLPTGMTPKGVAIADINGDGKLDVLTADIRGNYPNIVNPGGDTVSVLLGNGNGTFQARTSYTVGQAPFAVVVGRLNADAKLDVIAPSWHDGSVSVLLNTGP
jgi:hypothetical protein